MEDDNDDQWLYGEDSNEKSAIGEDTFDKPPETDVFSEKGNEAFVNPSVPSDDLVCVILYFIVLHFVTQ